MFYRLARPDCPPSVFHCTGGKDRTGICAALIMLALEVPEETIVHDHQLSNIYIANLLKGIYQRVESQGIDPELIKPFFVAPLNGIVSLLQHLKDSYGSAMNYLENSAGVDKATILQLRQKLLD
ncbi:MAG: tyrosine-protein phosphatase [Proteobacteria bacterium]|nr:tyrosine-protein phosphatase [Pseudomonadota bacterium]